MSEQMTSQKPYLIRALYDWLIDNKCTPYVAVHAQSPGVMVPQEYVKDGQIVLNIDPSAVNALHLGDYMITFSARFGGMSRDLQIPYHAVLAIYSRENGQGMGFQLEEPSDTPPEPPEPPTDDRPKGRPSLKVVK